MDPGPSLILSLLYILLSIILVLLNGFFVVAEFAIVKVRRTRMEELAGKGVPAAKISLICIDQMDQYLSATQLGITLVSLALGWIGKEAFYSLFLFFFPIGIGQETSFLHTFAAGCSFFIITLLHVVLGELIPKSMAIQRPEEMSLMVAGPLQHFFKISRPLNNIFTWMANKVLHRIGYVGLEESPLTEDELKLVMQESHEDGVISESEAQIISRAFEFSDKKAIDIMTPLDQVDYLSMQRDFSENLLLTRQKMFSRFPIASQGLETVFGIVHIKDVYPLLEKITEKSNQVFQKVARPVVTVSSNMRQDKILKLLKEKREHLALVKDFKTGVNIGVVTMEDILEELVGEIHDEYGN